MAESRRSSLLAFALSVYLLVVGVSAAYAVIVSFPTVDDQGVIVFPDTDDGRPTLPYFGTLDSTAQGMVALTFLAGATGSFLHAAQSISSYLGNGTFRSSWTMWYVLRPWIGGILGIGIYLAFRAGLVSGTDAINPYGATAIGFLGGWFSKTTTDKLQEVFETLFSTSADDDRHHDLTGDDGAGDTGASGTGGDTGTGSGTG